MLVRTKEQIQKEIDAIRSVMARDTANSLFEIEKLEKEIESLSPLPKQGRWKPKYKDKYYTVFEAGIVIDSEWVDDKVDNFRYKTGNCFKTEEEAELHLEKILFIEEVKDFIKQENDVLS